MKILFCTDGSKISFNALKNASHWLKDATVDTICAIDWSLLPNDINIEAPDFMTSCTNTADTILDYAKNEIEKTELNCGKIIKNCGSAIETILEQLEKESYDMVLMGSHGKKGIQKWLGSVSQEVISSTKISNYIAKEENKHKKVLFTVDGTSCAVENIKKILPNINLENKEIYICMVNEDPDLLFLDGTIDTQWLLKIQKHQQIYAANAINNIQEILKEKGIKITQTDLLTGIPAQKIIDYVKKYEIDLIVMGARNKSRLDRFLSGSVSIRVMENVMSDIWLARCKNTVV